MSDEAPLSVRLTGHVLDLQRFAGQNLFDQLRQWRESRATALVPVVIEPPTAALIVASEYAGTYREIAGHLGTSGGGRAGRRTVAATGVAFVAMGATGILPATGTIPAVALGPTGVAVVDGLVVFIGAAFVAHASSEVIKQTLIRGPVRRALNTARSLLHRTDYTLDADRTIDSPHATILSGVMQLATMQRDKDTRDHVIGEAAVAGKLLPSFRDGTGPILQDATPVGIITHLHAHYSTDRELTAVQWNELALYVDSMAARLTEVLGHEADADHDRRKHLNTDRELGAAADRVITQAEQRELPRGGAHETL